MTCPTDADPGCNPGSLRTSCMRCGRMMVLDHELATNACCPACEASPRTGASGSHPFTHEAIDAFVVRSVAGSFTLGYLDGGRFVAYCVGRADVDLNGLLHRRVGMDADCEHGRAAAAPHAARMRQSFPPSDTPAMQGIGPAVDARYTHFRFSYAVSARAAFENECTSYHALGEDALDNPCHPVPSQGTDWECPHAHPRS